MQGIRLSNQIIAEQNGKRQRQVLEPRKIEQTGNLSPFSGLSFDSQLVLPITNSVEAPRVSQANSNAQVVSTLKVLGVLENGLVVATDGKKVFQLPMEEIEKFRLTTPKTTGRGKQ